MRRTLKALISLYPRTWRNRYEKEFEALLDDVSPTWRMLFDVFGGALKMQWNIWSSWKIVAAFSAAGLVAALAFSLLSPDRYWSYAVLKLENAGPVELNAAAEKILSRSSLTRLIVEEDLYKSERARLPIEEIIEKMKQQDITIRRTGSNAFAISFVAPDAAKAQRTTQYLTAAFVDANVGSVIDPPSLPSGPREPRRSRIIIMGLVSGIIVGALFALFAGLKVWKLAAGLGIAGAIVGVAVAFALPERFASSAVIWYSASDNAQAGPRIRRIVAATTRDANLSAIVQRFHLYPNESRPERRLREHLHIEPVVGAGPAIVIRFDDRDRFTAQKVVADVAGRLIDETIWDRAGSETEANMTLELLDPPSLPLHAFFPKREMVVGSGLLVGLACAILLGVWRHYRTPLPVVAAR